jgi:hypothetical protein
MSTSLAQQDARTGSGYGGMRPLNPARLLRALILIAIAITPLFSFGEIVALLAGLVRSQQIAYTPVYIKALKDLLLVTVGCLAVLALLRSGRVPALTASVGLLLLYVTAAALLSITVDVRLVAAGLRWAMPVLLGFLLVRFVDEVLVRRIAHILAILLIAHVAMQVLQLFFMSDWFGTIAFGLAARVPGLFFIPNTAGFFAVLCFYFAVCHLERGRLRTVVCLASPVSVLLTQSGTGIIVVAGLMLLFVLGARRAVVLVPILPIVVVGFLWVLPAITGRQANYVAVSGGSRVDIFFELLRAGEWIPQRFGFATNTAVNFATNLARGGGDSHYSIVADSTYSTIVGNLGLVGFGAFLAIGVWWFVIMLNHRRTDLYAFTMLYVLYGATAIVTEAYPMNLLFAVLFAFYGKLGQSALVTTALPSRRRPETGSPVPSH